MIPQSSNDAEVLRLLQEAPLCSIDFFQESREVDSDYDEQGKYVELTTFDQDREKLSVSKGEL